MCDYTVARNFKRREQKQLKCMALLCSFLIVLSFCTVFMRYLGPLPAALNLQLSVDIGDLTVKQHTFEDTISNPRPLHVVKNTSSQLLVQHTSKSLSVEEIADSLVMKKVMPTCSITKGSDFCEINDDIRIDGNCATVFISSSADQTEWIIRPYARKFDRVVMKRVNEWSVKSATSLLPQCNQNHSLPAVLFSNGGYAGNIFHDFSDIIVPLYINTIQFNGEVQLVITNKQSWWIKKYQNILKKLSRYEVIDIDNQDDIHCFPRGIIGLKRHDKELNIDASQSHYALKDFRRFIRSSYSLRKAAVIKLRDGEKRKPRLLIISRKRTRAFTNVEEIAHMGRRLGFNVIVAEANGNLSSFAEIVNSCDVFLAVHGAAMTNMIFLPENAVFIQVVPFGGFEWLARTDYEEPAKAMKFRYLEYKIKLEESTLIQQYPLDHQVIRDPSSIGKRGWNAFRSVYMVKQNVKIDLNRFRSTLLKALELLHQ